MSTTNDSSPEAPWSIQKLSELLGGYINRLGSVWIEGQVTQWGVAAGNVYGKLSDVDQDAQVAITVWRRALENIPEGIAQGDRVIAQVKPSWWVKGGTLSMNVLEMRHTGLGDILEKLERLRARLAAEGLFDLGLKKKLPFLPRRIGLITGKDSDAEKDVLTNAALRWPDVSFRVEHAAVQGDRCVPDVLKALALLERDPDVDVIIIARGGGDFMNLLPFSDESLVRAVAQATTPVVSAIGHEADRPLLDDVADLRASTPTDAAKRVVPDVDAERRLIAEARARLDNRVLGMIEYEFERLHSVTSRPVIADPSTLVDRLSEDVVFLVARGVDLTQLRIERSTADLAQLQGHLRSLSPQSTLDRGYSIARAGDGSVVSSTKHVAPHDELSLVVSDGIIRTRVEAAPDSAG